MPKTYISSDGTEKVWPPPENWYVASDGRWWHPDDGPDGTGGERSGPGPNSTNGASPSSHDDADAAGERRFGTFVVVETPPSSQDQEPPEPGEGDPTGDLLGRPAIETDQLDRDSRRLSSSRVLAMGLIVVALAAAIALMIGSRPLVDSADDASSEADRDGSSSASEAIDPAGTPSPTAVLTPPDVPSMPGLGAEPGSQQVGPQRSSADQAPASTTEAVESAPSGEMTAAFREALAEQGFDTGELADDQITTFGNVYCVLAGGSADGDDFVRLRAQAIESSSSSLSVDDQQTIIATAVMAFCPSEAERLAAVL